jgi:hypothetical protein
MTTYTNDIYGVQQQIADEQAAAEKSFLDDSYKLASVQGGMMLANARDIGRSEGNMYAGLGRMLTGEEEPVNPAMARMQKLESIMAKIPEPDTVDEYIQLANLMNQAGLFGDAQEAMKMANEMRSSMPGPDEIIIKEIKTTDTDGTPVTKTVRFNKTKGVIVEVLSVAPTWQPTEPTEETYTYKSFPGTNEKGQRVDEMWKINSKGERIELMSTQLKDKPVTDTPLTQDEEIYEANLAPYVNDALVKIKSGTATTGIMSEEDMNAQARADGIRAYTKVQNLSKNQTDGTAFTKNVDFFLAQEDASGNKLYTLNQAIAQATSLDHKTVKEEDMILQNAAILEEKKSMTALEVTANDNVRLNSQMLSLLDSIETGAWEDVKFRAARWVGFDDDLSNKEMFFSLATSKVMEYTQMTKGAISDAEMALFQSAAVSLGKTTEGNRMLLKFAQAGALATKRVAQHMRTWENEQKANGTIVDYNAFINERERYRNSEENADFFRVIINDEKWTRLSELGDAINTNENLETMSQDTSTELGVFCANPANSHLPTYQQFCK